MQNSPLRDIEQLAREQSLPSDHGVHRVLTLAKHGPSSAIPFIINIARGLLSRTEDPLVDMQKSTDALNKVFRGLDLQTTHNATESITRLTRHCLNIGLLPQDILYAAQGAAHAEVMATLKLEGVKIIREPSAPQAQKPISGIAHPSSGSYGPPPGPPPPPVPQTPLGKHLSRRSVGKKP